MSASSAQVGSFPGARWRGGGWLGWLQSYFASDSRRSVQTAIGIVWLLDGGLQYQSFMYSKGFVSLLREGAVGQAPWISSSIDWAARIASHDLSVWNTIFATVQVLLGVGMLYRPTVKLTIAGSLAWVLVVWWFGEGFGMMFMSMAEPLTGAPGAVLLYGMVAVIVWPGRAGGLLGVRGARTMWGALWLLLAWLWLEAPSSGSGSTASAIGNAPSGMGWLTSSQHWIANGAQGNGVAIALVMAAVSAVIGLSVGLDRWARPMLWLAIAIELLTWIFAQGFGGILEGAATDPNSAPLLVIMAAAMFPLVSPASRTSGGPRESAGRTRAVERADASTD